jgi:adenosylcobinamide-GDP ribazoletransferase
MPPLAYETVVWLRYYTRLPIPPLPGEADVAPDPAHNARAVPLAGAVIGWIAGMVLVIAWLLGAHPFVAAALALVALIAVTDGRPERALAAVAERLGGNKDGTTTHGGLSTIADKLHLHHTHGSSLLPVSVTSYGVIAIALATILRVGAIDALAVQAAVAAGFVLVGAGAVSRAAAVSFALIRPETGSVGEATTDQAALQWLVIFGFGFGIVTVLPGFGIGATIAGLAAGIGAAALVTAFVPRAPGDDGRVFTGTAEIVAEMAFLVAVVAFARTP